MNTEKLQEVLADEAFVKDLFELESAAEVQAALKEKGVEMTEEEILGIRELLAKVEHGELTAEQLESGELPEELLAQVAGGVDPLGICIVVGIVVNLAAIVTSIVGRW